LRKVTEPVGVAVVPAVADLTAATNATESPAEGVARDDVRVTFESALTTEMATGVEVPPLKSASPL